MIVELKENEKIRAFRWSQYDLVCIELDFRKVDATNLQQDLMMIERRKSIFKISLRNHLTGGST